MATYPVVFIRTKDLEKTGHPEGTTQMHKMVTYASAPQSLLGTRVTSLRKPWTEL